MITAKVIRDSVSAHGVRLLTMKLRYPKFIHGEFMTHRVSSRNASSSRAVPTAKLLAEVRSRELRASPVSWGQNQKGMQADGELFGDTLDEVQRYWSSAACDAAYWAEKMMRAGAHKQVVNRVMEPFSHINVVVSQTEWANFFGLRLSKAAQPEMRVLAEAMWREFNESEPVLVRHGEWHLPFIDPDSDPVGLSGEPLQLSIKVSVARCARVSYESHETGRRSTIEEDVALHDRLLADQHMSPFEHPATPDTWYGDHLWFHPDEHGNFVGWRQRRKQIPGEAVAQLPEDYR